MIVARVINENGRAFNVRFVRKGERYGLDDCLVHDERDPLVEFWDATYENNPDFTRGLGQFTSRYYLSTLKKCRGGNGIGLCGHVPVWTVTGKNVDDVLAAINAIEVRQ
jgi:hypothetical protein